MKQIDTRLVIISAILFFIFQIIGWFQLYGHYKIDWLKQHSWWFIWASAVPIAVGYYYATKIGIDGFNGIMWPVRLMGFSMGIIAFATLTKIIGDEPITWRTAISIALAFIIVLIQVIK